MEYFENSIETKIESLKLEFENQEIELIGKLDEIEKKISQKEYLNTRKEKKYQFFKIGADFKKIKRQNIGSLSGLSFPIYQKFYQKSDENFINLCKNFFI
jgi:hypothetical protein